MIRMERLKGLLKRKSRRDSNNEISSFTPMDTSSVDSDPSDEPNGSRLRLSNSFPVGEEDNTHALMMGKIEQLTNEKYSIEETLSSLESQLGKAEEENLSLKSRCDDLEKSLELEKRRFRWQQSFYEKRIQQLAGLPVESTSVTDENPSNEDMTPLRKAQSIEDLLECNAFYEGTIKALVTVQETKSRELNELKNFYEGKLKALSLEHEADITEILESSDIQVQKIIAENEGLIRDLLTGCEGLFDELKVEYTAEARDNAELDTKSGENILEQFKGLSTPMKGIVVAGIAVISVATAGWASWGFVIWVWPRLLIFAEVLAANPESSLMYLMAFLNSVPFQSFLKSWEEGKPLSECLKSFANTEFLTSALRMAPDLFSQFKRFKTSLM